MKTFWIVFADTSRAIILSKVEGARAAELAHELNNPSGRLHISELVSGQRGRVEKRSGLTRSAMEPPTDPHEEAAITFARQICKVLDQGHTHGNYDFVILVAPSHFLGLLQHEIGEGARRRLVLQRTKGLMHMDLAGMKRYATKLVRLHEVVSQTMN